MAPALPWAPSPLGLVPLVLSILGAGLRVTELVWLIRWDRFGNVSEAELFSRGQWLPKGLGEVGVISPGARGVRGEEGV